MNDKQLNVRIPAKLHVALLKEARKRHVSASSILRQALLAELSRSGMPDLVNEAMQEVMRSALTKAAARLGAVRRVG